jgi:type II restriction/modification system DNA methylase subunit YeeA
MPVNTAALKTFAPAMRRQLLEAVGRKLDLLLHSQTPDTLSTYAKQISELREQEAGNREQLLERVAYTWFNRLCALRYLDAKGWHPFGCKVLMPAADSETQPELLKLMRAGSLPAELKPHTNEARLHGLLDGQIPTAIVGADPQGEVYRELVLASCRSYHQLLPELFEGLDDASELLLPDDLLSEGSIAGAFRISISDEDCEDVEIIGWLYQFYISEKKDQVIGKVVKSEDIPAATQLFTPNWIVKYMVQNSLGATWLATYPDSTLKDQMEFYIEPAQQTPEVQAQLAAITPESLDPEALTLIDPACGSGHILVEAYDLLKGIYLERGFRQRDIPELILTKNLFGLDICPRAAQLASFSLLMKGREDNRRLLERGIQLNVMALQNSTDLNIEYLAASVDLAAKGIASADLAMLVELFSHATTLGSLIQVPTLLAEKLPSLRSLAEEGGFELLISEELRRLGALVRQAAILERRYDAVVANPPYMGGKLLCDMLKRHIGSRFPSGKADLYAAFMLRASELVSEQGRIGMITMPNWLTLASFEGLRQVVIDDMAISSLVDNGRGVWGSDFGSCAFVLWRAHLRQYAGSFLRLFDKPGSVASNHDLAARFFKNQRFTKKGSDFAKIPRAPIAYWVSERVAEIFASEKPIGEVLDAYVGLQTCDNERFLRYWTEVSFSKVGFGAGSISESVETQKKWFPGNKGGAFRKWYGNLEYIVNWESDGKEIREFQAYLNSTKKPTSRMGIANNSEYYFRQAVTWSDITISRISFRFLPRGCLSDVKGNCAFSDDPRALLSNLAYLNTEFVNGLTKVLNPTVSFPAGYFRLLPSMTRETDSFEVAAKEAITLCKHDWDSYERSWDFRCLPLLCGSHDSAQSLQSSYVDWTSRNAQSVKELKALEEKCNHLVIKNYGLEDELGSEVPMEQITLTVNPDYRYGGNLGEQEQWARFRRDTMAELLSYATGCMMGRYSLDQPGLILADSRDNQAEQLVAYEARVGQRLSEVQFKPDPDGIIPVLDGEWFEDDIVARSREFLAVTFPESSVAENLRFIEESLGKDIRKYFCTEFYKDHLQTYKKRPIYWMVQSPAGPSRGGFACLIYLHRYTKDTLNLVLNNYFRPYLQKLEARLAQLGLDQLNDDLPARERTAARKEAEKITKVLKECQAWEQDALLPLAQQRIELDLDDGVKVNYLKLQDVLAPIPGLAAKEE